IERQAGDLYKGFIDNGELPPGLKRPYLTWEEVSAHGRGLPALTMGAAEGALEAPEFAPLRLYAGNIAAAISDLQEMIADKSRLVIVSQQSGRLRELMEDEDIYPTVRKGAVVQGSGIGGQGPGVGDPSRAQGGSGTGGDGYVAGVEQVAL